MTLYKKNKTTLAAVARDEETGDPINTIVDLEADLLDSLGAHVATFPNPLSLTYVAGSDGEYEGDIPATFDPAAGAYTLKVTADTEGYESEIPVDVEVRTIS